MRRIQSINIQEIGPFGSLHLDFPKEKKADCAEIHILTGENGTGKTTILELMTTGLLNGHPFDYNFRVRFPNENKDSIALVCENDLQLEVFQFVQNKIAQQINSSHRYWSDVNNPNAILNFAIFAYSGFRRIDNIQIHGIQNLPENPLIHTARFQHSGDPQQIMQWIANTIAAEAIASVQKDKKEAENRRFAVERLENAIEQIVGKTIKFHLETNPYNVKILVDDVALGFNLLPDGFKSIFSWLADLLIRLDRVKWENDTPVFERNFVLFLDEIEVHMHPAWQRKILPVVQKLFPNAQIFISTHSPFVVGSVDGAWIHKLVKPNGDSKLDAGFPMLSEDAKSYRYWLNEVFDIQSEYGVEAESNLKSFYALRDAVLKGANGAEKMELLQNGRNLAKQSQELRQIIEMELRQINRRLSLDLSL